MADFWPLAALVLWYHAAGWLLKLAVYYILLKGAEKLATGKPLEVQRKDKQV